MRLIRSLNPHPGESISPTQTTYVEPDVFVRRINNRWRVTLNPDTSPKLRVNTDYASLVRRADSSADNVTLKNHLQEARWFIKSLQSRNETLIKVASKIDQDFDFSMWLEEGTAEALCAAFPADKFVVKNFMPEGRDKVMITPRQSWSSLSIDIMLYRKRGDRALLYLYDDDWKPLWIRGVIFLIECFRGNGFEQHYSNRSFLRFVSFLKILPYEICTRSLRALLPDSARLRCTEFLETYLAMCRRIPLLYDQLSLRYRVN